MENQNSFNPAPPKDERLWKIAKRRAEFKKHVLTYLIINIFLWGIWAFSSIRHGDFSFPWPAFVTLGWGIGLGFNYISAYTGFKDQLTQKEYEKLLNKN